MRKSLLLLLLLLPLLAFASEQEKKRTYPYVKATGTAGFSAFCFINKTNPSIDFVKDKNYRRAKTDYKWGENYGGSAHFVFKNGIGLGTIFKTMNSSQKPTDFLINTADGKHYQTINIQEKFLADYFGLSIMLMRWIDSKQKFLVHGALSGGGVNFIGSGKIDITNTFIDGENWGANLDFGIDYFLTRNISIGLNIGAFYCRITEISNPNYTDALPPFGNKGIAAKTIQLNSDKAPNLFNITQNISVSFWF